MSVPSKQRPLRILVVALSLAAATFVLYETPKYVDRLGWLRNKREPAANGSSLPEREHQAVAWAVAEDLGRVERAPAHVPRFVRSSELEFLAYVCLRAKGLRMAEAWGQQGVLRQALAGAVTRAKEQLQPHQLKMIDTVELDLAYGFEGADARRDPGVFTNIHRGITGIQIADSRGIRRWAPTMMLARNLSFKKVLQDRHDGASPMPRRVTIFDAHQFLIELDGTPHAILMFRGNQIVPLSYVTANTCRSFAQSLAEWMENQIQPDGRMIYKYWPSLGAESPSDNAIRQFMATVCLQRWADAYGDETSANLATKNLAYNLQKFYRDDDELGFIEYGQKRKLGAAALAALAIVESPQRHLYRTEESKLLRLVDHLFLADGSFQTFFGALHRRDNQNFYPGEALLLWSALIEENRAPSLLQKFKRAFAYYRDWHRAHRNPAFVPWHTMAYYRVWRITKDPELEHSIFEMNDWLLGMQQWEGVRYPDIRGRFYDPAHAEFGPPHASSTGVYLEGLADAFSLARELGDEQRMDRYRVAILRGLRSAFQLQFADPVDMFYVSQRRRVRGGLRTTVYDNTIRVDNVQHTLMAMLKILRVFSAHDYVAGTSASATASPFRP